MSARWQRRPLRTRHADDWLMTYADMITLLLCFFAMVLTVFMAKKDAPPIPRPSPPIVISQTVKPVELLPKVSDFRPIPEIDVPETTDTPLALDAPIAAPAAQPSPVVSRPDENTDSTGSNTVVPDLLPSVAQDLTQEPPPTPALAPVTPPTPTPPQGDRITKLQMNSEAFFGSGSASLSSSGKNILRTVANDLKQDRYKDYTITIEGHTDDQPIKTIQFPSNWELSTARASAVVHFFLEQGLPAQRLRAAGYADTFPIAPNRDKNGKAIPENQARNRRVVIQLERIDKAP